MRILLAEDDEDMRRFLERALERARGANALRDIPTVPRRHGKFVLRLSENLRQKPKLEEASGVGPISRPKRPDPFERNNLDPDLVVCDLGSGHTVLPNKFPVVSPHLLVVTRDFEYVCSCFPFTQPKPSFFFEPDPTRP